MVLIKCPECNCKLTSMHAVCPNCAIVLSEEKTSDNNCAIPPFSVWEGTDDKDQTKRFMRASERKNTPIEIYTDSNSATFSGSHGVYHTSLDFCECRDFSIRKLPCKHIYRLAMELGLISTKFSSDKKAIMAPTDVAFNSVVDFLEENYCDKLPFFEYLLYCYTTKRKCFCENTDDYRAAIDIGFIRAKVDYYCIFEQQTQKKTIEDAEKAKLAFPEELKTKKSKFLWCKDNAELFNKTVYPDAAVIYPDGYMLQSARSIYSYLLRRNGQETFYLSELENLPRMVVQKLLEHCPDKIIR